MNLELVKNKQFDEVITETINNEILFELYSTGVALGQVKTNSVGKQYPRKNRIDDNIKNAEITTVLIKGRKFLRLDDVRKLISLSNTKNKGIFIDWLKEHGYIDQKEVFEFTRKEEIFIDSLERVLKPMGYSLNKQLMKDGYRFDGYIPELDMVIEYDENGHLHYDLSMEDKRDKYIEENFSYIVRVTDFCDLMTNIGMVMNKIIEVA